MAEQNESVTIILPPLIKRAIDERAKALGIESNELLPMLLTEALTRELFERRIVTEIRTIHQRVNAVSAKAGHRIDKLRESIANAVFELLLELNKALPERERSSTKALRDRVVRTFAK